MTSSLEAIAVDIGKSDVFRRQRRSVADFEMLIEAGGRGDVKIIVPVAERRLLNHLHPELRPVTVQRLASTLKDSSARRPTASEGPDTIRPTPMTTSSRVRIEVLR